MSKAIKTAKKKPAKKEIVLAVNGTADDILKAAFAKDIKKK